MRTPSQSEPRPLVIGEAPNRTGMLNRPIDGRCGSILAALGGVDITEFLRLFARANVLDAWPGPGASKGAQFPMVEARRGAERLATKFVRGRLVILLGHRTAAAFGVRDVYFAKRRIGAADVVVMPHPSGINRWYNDPTNVARARRFMRGAVRRARRSVFARGPLGRPPVGAYEIAADWKRRGL